MRSTLFISHATPEDNDFTVWIASRLQSMGYDIWIDKQGLIGGEKFWEEIDSVIREKAIKFLLVYSQNIVRKGVAGKLKDGISKEFSLAEGIGKQENISDFIIFLKTDDSPYNLFIGADRLNQIHFNTSWADGLKALLLKLEKDGLRPLQHDAPGLGEWYEAAFLKGSRIVPRKELYYSNFWPVERLPANFYLHLFTTEGQAEKACRLNRDHYPIGKISNILSCFEPDLNDTLFTENGTTTSVKPIQTIKIGFDDLSIGFEGDTFPTHKDASNHLSALLWRTFSFMAKGKGLFTYTLTNKRRAYFFPGKIKKVNFQYPVGSVKKYKNKGLVGRYLTLGYWHFAVSVSPVLSPELGYLLKSHLVFTSDGFRLWEDKDKIHSTRRKKGRLFFNEEWRDMMLAFIEALKNEERNIEVKISDADKMTMALSPELLWADFGYEDPNDKNRHDILNEFFEDESDTEENA